MVVLAGVFIALLANISRGGNTKEQQEKTEELSVFKTIKVKNQTLSTKVYLTGRVIPKKSIDVRSEVAGKILIQKKEFKEGIYFKKGEVLLQLDAQNHQFDLIANRSRFADLLLSVLPDFKQDFPDRFEIWNDYLRDFNPQKQIRQLPSFQETQERNFFTARGIPALFYTIKSKEAYLQKFTISAPFSGTITKSYVDVGSVISPQTNLAHFIESGKPELIVGVKPTDLSHLKKGMEIEFQSASLAKPVKGILKRIVPEIDPQTQQATLYFDILSNEVFSGIYLEGVLETRHIENVFKLPAELVNRQNEIYLIENSIIVSKKIVPEHFEEKFIFVSGLENGQEVLAERYTAPMEGTKGTTNH